MTTKRRVLLVEDDRDLAEVLCEDLIRGGYTVTLADSVQGAKEQVAEQPAFEVLITDLHLPDGEGVELARTLGIPICLALTGASWAKASERLPDDFAAVLVKPISGQQLGEALLKCLSGEK